MPLVALSTNWHTCRCPICMPTGVSNLFLTFNSLVEEGGRERTKERGQKRGQERGQKRTGENKRGQKQKSVAATAAAAAAVVVVVFT